MNMNMNMKRKNAPVIVQLVRETIDLNKIVPGPIVHEKLSRELEDRIRKFEPVFAEFYAPSHSEWLEGFQRDLDPESEVRVWEARAKAYKTFLASHPVIQPAKKEVFILLITAGGTIEETLSVAKLRYLSRQEAKHLLQLYAAALTNREQPFSPN
jgi:hypothetical protein